jgi:GH25 family lysozyme M1 (1,4-beta-N-acetylmuramidase)
MATKVEMIDVSHWNGTIDFSKVSAAGVKAVYAKATNGTSNTDNTFDGNIKNARAQGMLVGGYHFLLSQQDPTAQAAHFVTFTEKYKLDLLPVVDVEWDMKGKTDQWKSVPAAARVAMVGRFCDEIRTRTGRLPLIYTATSWWKPMIGDVKSYKTVKFGDCPLWIARYASTVGGLPAPWSSYAIWQYSATGSVSGIKGNTDLDSLNVSLESLKAAG